MKGSIRNKVFSYLLLAITFAQLTFHTIHVLTSHTHEDTIELNSSDLVHDSSTTCELCAKLTYPVKYLEPFINSVSRTLFPRTGLYQTVQFFHSERISFKNLRGPPAV